MSNDEQTWAPARIYLQREQGDFGSHTWCEDSVGDGDLIEEVAYVRADVADGLLAALRKCKFDSLNMSLADLEFCRAALRNALGE